MSQQVFWYNNPTQTGVPALATNASGTMIAILDGCLVNGFNSISVSTLTQTAGTAMATTASAHNFKIGDYVLIAGATPSAYNDYMKVLSVPSTTTFTFAIASGTTSPATGTITAMHPPMGWTKVYAGTNTAVYKTGITPYTSYGHYLQIEDNNPYADSSASFRVRIIENFSGLLDTGTTVSEQTRIAKTATSYNIFGDYKTFYLIMGGSFVFSAGEFTQYNSADQYPFFVSRGYNASYGVCYGAGGNIVGGANTCGAFFFISPSGDGSSASMSMVILKSTSQVGGQVYGAPIFHALQSGISSGAYGRMNLPSSWTYPSPVDNSLPMLPILVGEFSSLSMLRGRLRGVYFPFGQPASSSFTNNAMRLDQLYVDGTPKDIILCITGYANQQVIAFDLTGPWT